MRSQAHRKQEPLNDLKPFALGIVIALTACNDASNTNKTVTALPEWTSAFPDTTCLPPSIDTSAWKVVEGKTITFKAPLEYVDGPGIPIDVEGVDLVSGQRTMGYYASCAPFVGRPEDVRCREVIDQREAFILTIHEPNGRYFVGANWITEKGVLTFGGFSDDEEGQQILLAAIRTVRFKKSPE